MREQAPSAAFISLCFSDNNWPHAGLALTCFRTGFVMIRLLCGHLPDKFGGRNVAIVSLAVGAGGQLLLWLASSAEIALAGAFFTGIGCSMIFPAMGVEVIRRVRPDLRSTAVGGFSLFQDLAYGATAPVAGLFADHFGYSIVLMLGFAATVLGLLVALSSTTQKHALFPNRR
jgi:MFS family permease